MMYFIDHEKKSVHRQAYAGDRCGFTSTPVAQREFTNCPGYIEGLIKKENYRKCPHCVSVQTNMTADRRVHVD